MAMPAGTTAGKSNPQKAPRYDGAGPSAVERQEYRRSLAQRLAAILTPDDLFAVLPNGDVDRGLYYASLLNLEADPDNHFLSIQDGVDGEPWTAGSVGYRATLRISPTYSQEIRRRAMRVAAMGIERAEQTLSAGQRWAMKYKPNFVGSYRWRHVTLTMQHEPGTKTFDEVKRFNKAFDLLRKRGIWRKVRAGIKGIEDRISYRGAHVHAHILILSRWLDPVALNTAWSDCIGGQGGGCKVQLIRARGPEAGDDPGATCSLKVALTEVCKYITKTEDLLQPDPETGETVSRSQLLDLCDVERWPRMFELLGMARDSAVSRNARLILILPEYTTAAKLGQWSKIEQIFMNLRRVDAHTGIFWRVGSTGEVEWGERLDYNPHPVPVHTCKTIEQTWHSRAVPWRKLMQLVPSWRWFEMIEKRALHQAKGRKIFLERKTNKPVRVLTECYG